MRINKGFADKLWENLLLGMIGEQFELANVVTGIVIQIGFEMDKIQIWFKHNHDEDIKTQVKKDLIRILETTDSVQMSFVDFFAPKSAKPTADKSKEYNASRELKPFKTKSKGA